MAATRTCSTTLTAKSRLIDGKLSRKTSSKPSASILRALLDHIGDITDMVRFRCACSILLDQVAGQANATCNVFLLHAAGAAQEQIAQLAGGDGGQRACSMPSVRSLAAICSKPRM